MKSALRKTWQLLAGCACLVLAVLFGIVASTLLAFGLRGSCVDVTCILKGLAVLFGGASAVLTLVFGITGAVLVWWNGGSSSA